MKKYLTIIISLVVSVITQSCESNPDFKIIRQQVLDGHDQLMSVSEQAMNMKIMLDTLDLVQLKQAHPELDTVAERAALLQLSESLGNADDRMSDWMHNFNTDFKGSPDQAAAAYFIDQKKKVAQLDSLYKSRIGAANDYLKKFNIKTLPPDDRQ